MLAFFLNLYQWFDASVYEFQLNYLNPQIKSLVDIPAEMIIFPWLPVLIIFVSVFFVIPVVLFISLYVTTLVMYVYRHRRRLDIKRVLKSEQKWKGLLYIITTLWEAHGYFWHGYEVDGFEHIPKEGPALIVYYHGVIPLDHFYLMTKVLLYKKRLICSVGDHFLFMIPGTKTLMRELKVLTGPVEECVKLLNDGHLLSIAPGGTREGLFGDNRYKLMWNNRIGFAKVAVAAKVPIIPVFTQNLREAFVATKQCRCILRTIYEWTRLPVVPFIGGFPVKLTTRVGQPIPYDPTVTPEELAQRTKLAIEDLIREHQDVPGSIWGAFWQRFYKNRKPSNKKGNKNKGISKKNK